MRYYVAIADNHTIICMSTINMNKHTYQGKKWYKLPAFDAVCKELRTMLRETTVGEQMLRRPKIRACAYLMSTDKIVDRKLSVNGWKTPDQLSRRMLYT